MSHWLAEPRQLEALARNLEGSALALDTEFIRERTYFPKLALVQLRAAGGDACLIDPLALPAPGPLLEALNGPTLKIMHSPGEDLQAFHCGWQVLIEPIFDTQHAAALVGLGAGKSYQALVAELLDIHLEKGETRSDWLRRPLSESQCHYAAEDVQHLHALHDILATRLERLGRSAWLAQDCARLVDAARHDAPEPNPHLVSRAAQRMDPEQQARLRRLLLWRETTARSHDKPRTWILDNELLVQLALRPLSHAAFDALLDRHPRAPRRLRGELWKLVAQPLEDAERDIPLIAPADPALRQPLKAMQAIVARHAAELDLPEGLLCARRHLESLLGERRWPNALDGWRSSILKQELLAELP